MHIPRTFHASLCSRPHAVGTSKSDSTLWYPASLRGVFGKTFLRLFCGAISIPCRTSEHDTAVCCLPSRTLTCGFHASLLQDAFRIKFELPVTTWETSNHLCTLQELAVFMEARYPAELLWPTRDIDLSTVVLYKELSAAEVSTSASPLAICTKFIGRHFLSFLKPIKLFKAKLASTMGHRGGSGEDLKCQLNSSAPSTFIQ
jgi:hypothetical protein